jgi:L-alanine-DL-glutamate epimerase-like enolase superfamily enzyme
MGPTRMSKATINRITVYSLNIPVPGGNYRLSGGRSYSQFESTIVSVETSSGIVGWGETCTLGSNYLPAFGKGVRAGIDQLAPSILGQDPLQMDRVNNRMDRALLGHPYAKSAIDIACWDIFGKVTGMPVCNLLGGRFGDGIDVLSGIPTGTPEAMAELAANYRARSYRRQSMKLGGEPCDDIARIRAVMAKAADGEEIHADCNGGWTIDQALRVMRSVRDLDLYFEQPCATYEECLALRRRTDHPMILDEVIDGPEMMLRIVKDRGADMINIKISRVGGLTKARRVRDICVTAGLPVSLQDTGGGALTQSAIVHLAQSTPETFRRSLYNPMDHSSLSGAREVLKPIDGRLTAPDSPGLGVEVDTDCLGAPVGVYQ